MDVKKRLIRSLCMATCDKTELNKSVLKWKKHFDEAKKALGKGPGGK